MNILFLYSIGKGISENDLGSGLDVYNRDLINAYLEEGHKVTIIINNKRKNNEYIRKNLTILPLFDNKDRGKYAELKNFDYTEYDLIVCGTAHNIGLESVLEDCPSSIPVLIFAHDDITYGNNKLDNIMQKSKHRKVHLVRVSDITEHQRIIDGALVKYSNLTSGVVYSASRIENYYDCILDIENRGNNCLIISRPHGDKGVSISIRLAVELGFEKIYYFGSTGDTATTRFYQSLSEKVVIMGMKPISEIIETAKNCKCMIHLPTYIEVGPLTTIEMASIGIPSISSIDRCGLFSEDIGVDVKYKDYNNLKKYKNIDLSEYTKEKVREGYLKFNIFDNWKKEHKEVINELHN